MKLIRKITKKLYDQRFGSRCEIRPGIRYFDETHFKGLKKDDYSFNNDNGFTLRGGIYHYEKYDKDTLVIFCHGMFGGHQAYMKEINYLAKSGFQVLSLDYQGTILSEGDKVGGPTQALLDMSKCVSLIKNNYKNIYVIGHSWGSFVAQGLAGLHSEIKKVCMLSPMANLKNLVKQYFKWYVFYLRKDLLKIEYEIYGDLSNSDACVNLNRSDLSSLVIQSTDDNVLSFNLNLNAIKDANCNDKVEFCIENGKKHNCTYTHEAVRKLGNYLHELNKAEFLDEQLLLAENANWDALSELDEKIMDKIVTFFKK